MTGTRFSTLLAAFALSLFTSPAEAQIFDKIKKKVSEAKETIADARAIRCDVQGVCGEVWQSELFTPNSYETMAVTVFDGTKRYAEEDSKGMVRDAFEGKLLESGFLLAASTDTDKVRERIARGDGEWTDDKLAQLKDFIQGVDAVLVVDIRQLQLGRCQVEKDGRQVNATAATVSLSARWLNVDVGDIPWVAKHEVTVCEDGGPVALSAALETAAAQLSTTIPARS